MIVMRRHHTLSRLLVSLRARSPEQTIHRRVSSERSTSAGPGTPPLLNRTIGQHFDGIVSQHGDRTAVISRQQQAILTYHELNRDSEAIAKGLRSRGVKKGDRVAVWLGNTIENALITYALVKLGAILVPLNPAFNPTQIIAALNHLSVAHLVMSTLTHLPYKSGRPNLPLLDTIIPDLSSRHLLSETVPSLSNVIIVDNSEGEVRLDDLHSLTKWKDMYEEGKRTSDRLTEIRLHPEEIINIQFTSGTTGMPKAACLTHHNILNNGNSIGDRLLLTPNDSICCAPPLYHCFGSVLGFMAAVTHGSATVFPSEAFNPEATLRAVQEYACTALHGVPTMFLAELELLASGAVPSTGLQHLRTGIISGTSVPEELMHRLHNVMNLKDLTICYGMTETSPVSFMTTTEDPIEKMVTTVGKLLPHVRAKVVSSEDRTKVLRLGEQGELAVAGYNVMKGYWGDPTKTAEVLVTDADGIQWMHTGDEAEMDADGYVRITGRLKDIIIRGGENIHPLDIENCLISHPSIADASACGIPDEKYGEVVAVFVILRRGAEKVAEDEVRAWVRERLSGHLVPKQVFYCEDFPKTPSGKVQRFKLRDQAIAALVTGR